MSVATKNPFALLEAEDSSRPSSPVSAPNPAAAAPAPPAPARGSAQKSRGGPAARGGKYYARGGAKSGARDEGTGNLNQNGIEDAPQDKKFDGRGRGRGSGPRGGAGRGGRGRQFDKHSQTGKVDTEKRINQGWGAAEGTAELKAEEAAVNDATAEAAPTGGDWGAPTADAGEWGAPATEATDAWTAPTDGAAPAAGATEAGAGKSERDGRPPRREREPEEEDNTLTLEQYIAQQKEKESSVIPKLEGVRKANEGADANIWKDVVALEKSEEDAYFVGKSKAAPKARTKKEEKVFLEIEARFDRPRGGGRGRGGDDRGGRGARGGGRGRGAPRGGSRPAGNYNSAQAVNVDDETAFPSLS